MYTGGAYRPFRHDRHFSDASSFQTGVSRGRRIASNGRLARVLHRLHQPRPPLHCPIADSDDLARVYRFDLAQDSEMISPTIPI
jgi:hypothetical protein